jgi:hypothetical protein
LESTARSGAPTHITVDGIPWFGMDDGALRTLSRPR